jgi:pimeloyl-ACP methyl ester carboxylesterase
MTEALRKSEIRAMGVRTPVIEAGPPGAEEAVVFLHGHPGSSKDWADLLPRVSGFARAVAFDLPGFGGADKPKRWDYSAGGYATWLATALSALGIKRAHLVVHDFGGPPGLLWGLAHPGAFASVVMIDIGVLVGYRWHPIAYLYRVPVVGELMTRLTFEWAFRRVMAFYNPQPRKLPPEYVDQLWAGYGLGARRTVMRFFRVSPAGGMESVVDEFHALDRPALVVWGRHDPAIRVEHAERQLLSFRRAEIVVMDDSGHWPHIDDPEGTARAIVPFLERQVGRARPEAAPAEPAVGTPAD